MMRTGLANGGRLSVWIHVADRGNTMGWAPSCLFIALTGGRGAALTQYATPRTPSMMPGDEALAASGLVFTPGAHTSLGVFQPRGDILLQIRCTWIYGIRLGETSTYF